MTAPPRLPAPALLALLLLLPSAACRAGDDRRAVDTSYAPPPLGGSLGTPADRTPADGVPADSARVERVPAESAPTDSAPAPGAPAATPGELAALRGALVVPVQGVAADRLPDTFDEMRGTRRHDALDIPAPRGTPVLSAADGRVLKLFTSENGGLMVYAADATERFILMYAHLDGYAPGVREGMPLRRGQVIGYVGTTGNAPPDVPHLHFAIARAGRIDEWWKGTPVNPRPLLAP
ncbi:MAG TPA: M23 family metallopeptidase [Gemmatimonadaceae bacterium]|nr:M23 family metallopeptidase [Gemmatimonadaceae bacterium]